MPLFDLNNHKVIEIPEIDFSLEKELQTLVENNIEKIFNLKFVRTELQINDLRIDSLAFDEENNSFVIIEYKRDKNFSVIDQGMSYLALMLNHKADFVLASNESGNPVKISDIDWTQSKVLFLAQSFTKYQRNAVNFRDLPIELWEVRKYKNGTLFLNQIKSDPNSESFHKVVGQNEVLKKISSEVKLYQVEDHLNNIPENVKNLYQELSEKLLDLDDRLEINSRKKYIGFMIDGKNTVAILVYKNHLTLAFGRTRPEDLTDIEHKLKYRPSSMKNQNQHISDLKIENTEDINYGVQLARELLEKHFK